MTAAEIRIEAVDAVTPELGVDVVDLTSRPGREAANRLYRRVGFEPRETNVYRFRPTRRS